MRRLTMVAGILKESIHRYVCHSCVALSASISFYAMFSFFPLLLLTLSILATVGGSSELAMERMANIVSTVTPVGASIVMEWVRSIGQTKPLAWGIGILALVWGARHVFNTLALSASIIWGRKGWMDVIRRQVISLVLVGFAALMLLASIFLPGMVERLSVELGFPVGYTLTAGVLLVPYILSFVTFSTVFLLTCPGRVPRKNVVIGAAVVSLTWEIAKNAFLGYIRMTQITSAYGSIGGIIVLMAWIYLSSSIVLWGMELVAATVKKPKEESHLKHTKGVLVIE
ncbi:MAG: YihY/virulence factor BrkB family protein [Candidatus Eisenbacteria bacterium]